MSKTLNNPFLDAKELKEMVRLNTEATLKNIMEQSIKENMKNMIKESDDEDYEEEVEVEKEPVEVDVDVEVEGGDAEEDDFSEFEVDDDTLDLTDASDEDLIKVFKKVQNDTQVEVTQDDGKVEVSDNETGAEYIIDLDGLDEANLGYTTTYQRPTGINIPAGTGFQGNKPLGDKNSPNNGSGNVRNYGKKIGDGAPFNESEEVDIDEGKARTKNRRYRASVIQQNSYQGTNSNTQRYGDYVRDGGQLEKVGESKIHKLEKQFNTLKEENKILKECVRQFKEAAQAYYVTSREVAMTNYRLGKVVNLFTENATTLEEKQNILERLQNCKTEPEINSLHEIIKTELKNKQPLYENINKGFEVPETQTVTPNISKPIFINEDVEKTINFMNRVLSV
jgi:hypothetical protein